MRQNSKAYLGDSKVTEVSVSYHGGETDQSAYAIDPENLGSAEFKRVYGIKYAYLTGSMYRAVASTQLVVAMGKANLMGFFGTGGLSILEIKDAIQTIQAELSAGQSYGMNLLCNQYTEMDTIALYLKYGVSCIEAADFSEITPALVCYRLTGLRRNAQGELGIPNKIVAKISRPEVAAAFMRPAPVEIVKKLLEEGRITEQEASLSQKIPVSFDICVEADSGGHTDQQIPTVLLPSILKLREKIAKEFLYRQSLRVGLSGGIGTPEAAAAAFTMGADFILTGSINQCTVESGMSAAVKSMIQDIGIQDTDYAPAGDRFESGSKVQVLKRGVEFPTRANKLHRLYQQYASLDDIPQITKAELEEECFKKSLTEIWIDTREFFSRKGLNQEIEKAESNPKHKMALVFRWYFGYSNRLAFSGEESLNADFQVHTGPALGAFNQWVKGTELEKWNHRHVDKIAEKIMFEAAALLSERFRELQEKMSVKTSDFASTNRIRPSAS